MSPKHLVAAAAALVAPAIALACSSSSPLPPPATNAVDGGDAGAASEAGEPQVDSGKPAPIPDAASIQFAAKAKLPAGESIVFNDWGHEPNVVLAMTPDGSKTTAIFQARRIWSMGVSRSGGAIAFSSEDPFTEARYGIQITDAIQQTWIYDDATQSVRFSGVGNVNDECHHWAPGDSAIWVCRRYDFGPDASNKGWRLGRLDPTTFAFTFESPEETGASYAMGPQITPDGKTLYWFTLVVTPPNKQTYTIRRRPTAGGAAETVRADAGRLSLSPDGQQMAYVDYAASRAVMVARTDGTGTPVKITNAQSSHLVWSPDGTRVAYLADDAAANCQHVDVVPADGSGAATPTRLHDCAKAKDFITQLAWITR